VSATDPEARGPDPVELGIWVDGNGNGDAVRLGATFDLTAADPLQPIPIVVRLESGGRVHEVAVVLAA
jgi:hypothetical protein